MNIGVSICFFFFNDTATTEIYTLSLHRRSSDLGRAGGGRLAAAAPGGRGRRGAPSRRLPRQSRALGRARGSRWGEDRKSTRLNSRHANISDAVFCLKKKKKHKKRISIT